uniref:Uncharacterized protein n=1 Tax=Aegilops tauschii subsp. strangulata TaxID=200361 RepID=A0A453QZQ4_AEGTS
VFLSDDRRGGAAAGLPDEPRQDQVIIGFAAADVPVGGAAATFGGASATAPKGNLHQTLPHNSASKSFGGGDPCDGDSL